MESCQAMPARIPHRSRRALHGLFSVPSLRGNLRQDTQGTEVGNARLTRDPALERHLPFIEMTRGQSWHRRLVFSERVRVHRPLRQHNALRGLRYFHVHKAKLGPSQKRHVVRPSSHCQGIISCRRRRRVLPTIQCEHVGVNTSVNSETLRARRFGHVAQLPAPATEDGTRRRCKRGIAPSLDLDQQRIVATLHILTKAAASGFQCQTVCDCTLSNQSSAKRSPPLSEFRDRARPA